MNAKTKTPTPIHDQLLDALRQGDVSCYRIEQETGVDKSVLSRFKSGQRPQLSLEVAERIAAGLGLRLVLVRNKG